MVNRVVVFSQVHNCRILLLATGVWLCSQIQTGTTGISYVGTQAMFAFVMRSAIENIDDDVLAAVSNDGFHTSTS